MQTDLSTACDATLLQSYAQGHMAAFEVLYDRHATVLWRYFLRNTGDSALAEDLSQEVWIAVVDRASTYTPTAKFTTWMFAIAHNKLVDHWRKTRPTLSLEAQTQEGMDLSQMLFADSGFEPDQLQHRKDAAQTLLAALAELPAEQREAFLLQVELDMSVIDIAATTGVAPETAKSRLRYARAKLRQSLEAVV